MSTQQEKAERFLALHHGDGPLLLANAWDQGSAKLFESLGFQAVATTSSGFAATLGRLDGNVTLDEVLAHCAAIVAATDLPVSADFENGFADDPSAVAANVASAAATGLAGCSVEDFTRRADDPIYAVDAAAERVTAAAEAAHAGPARLVLTARAENFLHGRPDLGDTIARLQRYQEAGADVLFAPGVSSPDDIRQVIKSVDRPVNVITLPNAPTIAQLAELGVARVSIGGAFAWVALGAVVDAARELLDSGTYGFFAVAASGRTAGRAAFTSSAS
jgi:2-methylisocitrate lyase-like PEP mutase family enzyme